MCAAGIEAIGLLEQEARQHRDDQRPRDCDIGAVRCVNQIDDATRVKNSVS